MILPKTKLITMSNALRSDSRQSRLTHLSFTTRQIIKPSSSNSTCSLQSRPWKTITEFIRIFTDHISVFCLLRKFIFPALHAVSSLLLLQPFKESLIFHCNFYKVSSSFLPIKRFFAVLLEMEWWLGLHYI